MSSTSSRTQSLFSTRAGFPSGLRVLLVDKDTKDTAALLRQCNYAVSVHSHIEEGLKALRSSEFDVVVAGLHYARMLHSSKARPHGLPLIVMCEGGRQEEVRRHLESP